MDSERWSEIERLFHRVLKRAHEKRTDFLEQEVAGDEDLRKEVESLLAYVSTATDAVNGVVARAVDTLALGEVAQREFGPYRAVRKIAESGLSTVYLGERTDDEYQRQVAIKVAKRGFPSEDLELRFRQERQILASLKHPTIAEVFDGGTTEKDHLPYFVMEFIEGEPINQYCDRLGLSIDKRLQLFQSVCGAVEHAHRNLVIHRDLKPSNILVTQEGVPKLLDFGIAKLLEPDLATFQPLDTAPGLQLLTPEYASPEQFSGSQLSTATDIYSLGTLLYQLLTGQVPHSSQSKTPKEQQDAVLELIPRAPSVAVAAALSDPLDQDATRTEAAREQVRKLKGDLDVIVLKALHKEPGRRYSSVAEFSEDVDRYLKSQPIRARKDSLAYRANKFVQRHRFGVTASGAFLLTLLIGIVATSYAAVTARKQRLQAELNRENAERVTEFMVGLFNESNPEHSRGEQVLAREVLDQGAEKVLAGLENQPVQRAHILDAMGQAYHGLGAYEQAAALHGTAVDDRIRGLGGDDVSVADSLIAKGRSNLAIGDLEDTEANIQRALNIYLVAFDEGHLKTTPALNLLAEISLEQGDLKSSEAMYQRVLDIRLRSLSRDHQDVLQSLNNLAEVFVRQGRFDEAEKIFVEVLDARRRTDGNDHPETVKVLSNLAVAQQAKGDLVGAEQTARDVIKGRHALYGQSHPHVALAYSNLGQILILQGGQNEEALNWTQRAREVSEELYGREHPRVATITYNLGRILDDLGNFDDAEERLSESIEIRQLVLGSDHPDLARSLVALADLHWRRGKYTAAMDEAQRGLRILEESFSETAMPVSSPLIVMGQTLAALGRCDEAVQALDRALEIRQRHLPPSHPALATVRRAAAQCR